MGVLQAAATIANGQTTSGAIDLGGHLLCGLEMPAAFTGATVTFLASTDAIDYSRDQSGPAPVFRAVTSQAGVATSATVSASKYVAIDSSVFQGVRQLKIVSASAELAARVIGLALRPSG